MKQHFFTKATANALLTGLLMCSALPGQQALADGVKIFTGPPPAAEDLAAMLFSEQPEPRLRTRSIVLLNQDSAQPAPTQRKARKTSTRRKARKTASSRRTQQASNQGASGFGLLINFALNSSDLLPDARPYLDQVGKMMKLPEAAGQQVVIEGHTDASGSAAYNEELSIRRAQAVKRYLVRKHNVSPEQLIAVGKGETQLLPDRDPRNGMNRRVQFHRASL